MMIAVLSLSVFNLVMLVFVLWVLSNIRDDQMMIRTFMAKELRAKRADMGAPTDDAQFYAWLQRNPHRPHKDDPPFGGNR